MKEEDVFAGIREHVRAERADDAALEALARGDVGSAAAGELERRAEEGDVEARALIEASHPLETEAVERLVATNPALKTRTERGRVLPFVRRAAVIAAPLAIAATLVLYLGRTPQSGVRLPEYGITASGEKEMRGEARGARSAERAESPRGVGGGAPDRESDAPQAVLQLRGGADATFEILARPMTSAGGSKVIAYLFGMSNGEPNPVDAKIEIAPEGAVRIRGRASALVGARELRVVVGTAGGAIKRYEDALSRARDGKTDAEVRVLVIPIARQ